MRCICHQCDTIHVHLHPSTYSVFQNNGSINGYRLNEVYQKVEKRACLHFLCFTQNKNKYFTRKLFLKKIEQRSRNCVLT